MNKLITASVVAIALSGCGAIKDLKDRLANLAKLNAGQIAVVGNELTENITGIKELSGGIAGLAPNLNGGSGSIGLAPMARMAPINDPEWVCAGVYSGTVTDTKKDYRPEEEEAEAVIELDYECRQAAQGPYIVAVRADVKYKDSSTGTTSFVEISGDTANPNDVLEGFSRLTVHRWFGENDERSYAYFEAEVDLLGDWAAPNKWRYGKFIVRMRNNAEVTAEVTASTPVTDGEDFTDGTATRTTIHADGEIKVTTETATITGKDTGTYTLVNEYNDGTKDTVTVTADGQKVTLDAKGHNGFTRQGSLQLQSGDYELVTTFPATFPIKSITESGKWHKNATSGTYNRSIVWVDGHVTETKADVAVVGSTVTATFTHEDHAEDNDKSDLLSGVLTITGSQTQTDVTLDISNVAGDKATLEGVRYADGTAKLHFTKDLISTEANPDEEGDIAFLADGSGSGTVTVAEESGKVTYSVTINADGSGEARDAAGNVVATF